MYKIIQWTKDLDLTEFYKEAASRGFKNNSSQKEMIDCFQNESKWAAWMLYEDDRPIGSVAAHSFDDVMGPGSYRVLTRCCILKGTRKNGGLMTAKTAIAQHQNLTDQFLLPTCISWAGKNIYATSNVSTVASQRFVHRTYFPTLEKIKVVSRVRDLFYRGVEQTVWRINVDKFEENLKRYPRWV
jgi:hypothetical protein